MLQDEHKQLIDGLILAGARITQDSVRIGLTDKGEAQYLYRLVKPISNHRELQQANDTRVSRDWYDENITDDSNELHTQRHQSQVYDVYIEPDSQILQRAAEWIVNESETDGMWLDAPDDFEITQTVCKLLYLCRATEMSAGEQNVVELQVRAPTSAVQAAFEAAGFEPESVNRLFRFSGEEAQRFREYARVADTPTEEIPDAAQH